MGLKQDIIGKVTSILDNRLSIENVSYVPDLEDPKLTFDNTGLEFEATVLFIDIRRGSAEGFEALDEHSKSIAAKIRMAYFSAIVQIANALRGQVRSFNRDSLFVFFQGTTKRTLNNAVKAAMQITYMISNEEDGINGLLKKYTPVDFGIGIDDGRILCTKVGIPGTNTKELVWVSNSVNKAVFLSGLSKSPNHIAISSHVYDCMEDDVKYCIRRNAYGKEEKLDKWTKSTFSYNNTYDHYYYTNWYWSI